MAVTFQSILDMSEITNLNGADKFLVARGDDTYYTSYQTTYSALSNTLYNNFVENAYKLSVVTNENELADSLKSKAIAGNIGYMFKTRISDLSAAVVTKDGNQDISGIKNFLISPTVPNVDSTNQQAVVNYHTLTSWVWSHLSCTDPLFTTVFAGQRCNLSNLFVSRVCPMWNSTTFPTSFTIYCSFYTTGTSNITPVFKVYDTTPETSIELPTTRYLGTETINASTASSNKNSHYCKYSCFVGGIKADKTKIAIDNKNANTMISLTIYPWKMPESPESTL